MTLHAAPVRRRSRSPAAFTLIEALVAIAITAMAASSLLLGITSSLQTTDEALKQSIAIGMARQLMDEVLGHPYYDPASTNPYQTVLCASSDENNGPGRERYDEIGDYNGVEVQPAEDLWGIQLGAEDGQGDLRHPSFQVPPGFLDHWRQEVDVYYVDESDPSSRLPSGQVSDYRAVEVRILYVDPERGSREMARLRQVVAYVPRL